MIKTVVRCKDNSVMAFDENGELLPLYLGSYNTVKASIIEDSRPGTVFSHYFDNEAMLIETPLEAW